MKPRIRYWTAGAFLTKGMSQMGTSIVFVAVVGGVVCLLIGLRTIFSAVRKRMEVAIREKFEQREIIRSTPSANFLGVKSKGGMQMRGNGALVLTGNELYFLRAFPEKEFRIPIETITAVSLPKSFNGKSRFSPLLCVNLVVDDGEDSMAWSVKQPREWKEEIEALIKENR